MDINTLIIILVGAVVVFLLLRKQKPHGEAVLLQNQFQEVVRTLDAKLGESTKQMQSQFEGSTRIIRDVTERLTKLDETNKQVLSFSEQLQKMQDILHNPKQRGIYGEYSLALILQDVFTPEQYQTQYSFKDGKIVDAVIFLGEKIVPIDSKFSLENYVRMQDAESPEKRVELQTAFKHDLRKRIDETAQYIRPEEGTLEYAIMFIPAEGVFREIYEYQVGASGVSTRDLMSYAKEKRVHLVSPTTLLVTIQSIWHGIRDYQIQESAKGIVKDVGILGKHIRAYDDYFKRVGTHLNTTVNAYDLAQKELKKIDKDVVKISGGERVIEPLTLERPHSGEEDID